MIKIFLILFSGGFLFLSVFYWRFIRERPIGLLNLEYNHSTLFLYIFSICCTIFTLYSAFISTPYRKNIFMNIKIINFLKQKIIKIKKILDLLYDEYIKYFYDFILYKIPLYIKFIKVITPKWYSMQKYFFWLAHLFIFIPPFSFFCVFYRYCDIKILYFFSKINFFLLLTLLLKAITYSIKENCETDLGTVQRNIYFDPEGPDGSKYYIREELWNIKPELAYILHTKLNYFLKQYKQNLQYMEYSENFENYLHKPYPKLYYQLLGSIFWLISWLFMVFYLLQ